jgi:hypothetical protein
MRAQPLSPCIALSAHLNLFGTRWPVIFTASAWCSLSIITHSAPAAHHTQCACQCQACDRGCGFRSSNGPERNETVKVLHPLRVLDIVLAGVQVQAFATRDPLHSPQAEVAVYCALHHGSRRGVCKACTAGWFQREAVLGRKATTSQN